MHVKRSNITYILWHAVLFIVKNWKMKENKTYESNRFVNRNNGAVAHKAFCCLCQRSMMFA